jgi:uncharacterized protein (DUF1501 family)
MLTIPGRSHRHCGGTRREFLRIGAAVFGGLTLPQLLRADAPAARKKSVIYIVLSGGISHIDTWDPKPDAPAEFRGEFGTISTALPGVRITDQFPRLATMLDSFALLRGVRSVENDHFLSEVYTGLPRTAGERPAFGSVASKLLGSPDRLPAYVSLNRHSGDRFEFEQPHYAGSVHAPFRPFGEALDNLTPVKDLARLADRKELLRGFDTLRRDLDASQTAASLDRFQAQALEMVTSAKVREAFDLSKESPRTIDRYGRGGKLTHQAIKTLLYDWDPKPFVLARRLVEAGVRVVTLSVGSWDHHSGAEQHIFESYRHCLPALDRSITALVEDLTERGLIDDVLVAVLGEFGRTPKLSYPGPGREHWADAGAMLFAGGGIKVGQVVGETDRRAERARSGKMSFENVMSTVYHVLGIDPSTTLPDFRGRPQYLLDDREPVKELVG